MFITIYMYIKQWKILLAHHYQAKVCPIKYLLHERVASGEEHQIFSLMLNRIKQIPPDSHKLFPFASSSSRNICMAGDWRIAFLKFKGRFFPLKHINLNNRNIWKWWQHWIYWNTSGRKWQRSQWQETIRYKWRHDKSEPYVLLNLPFQI